MDCRSLTVLYGSQTGTAQEVAERIWRESKRLHFTGPVKAMNDYHPPDLPLEKFTIFVCSTTGQGEEPDNMLSFWRFLLRKSLSANSLSNTYIAVLGLGDSSYTKYNFAAKKLYRRLIQLGANAIIHLGLADDQHDLGADAVIDPWISLLWQKILELCPLPPHLKPIQSDVLSRPKYVIHLIQNSTMPVSSVQASIKCVEGQTPLWGTLLSNERTTSKDHFQDVRLLKMHSPELKYKPGDVLFTQPCNSEENIKLFLKLLGLGKDDIIIIDKAIEEDSIPLPPSWLIPKPCSVTACASQLLDLQALPTRYSLQLLAHFTSSDLERERLLEFCSPEGQQDLFDYCHRPKRTILEVLQDFPFACVNLPIEYLFDVFRPIRPRAFSIASALEVLKDELELLVAVVHYKTRLQAPRLGLCSNWFASLKPGALIPFWIRSGSFHFPESTDVPFIMVGPGTGCAPFRSVIQQRYTLHPNVKGKMFLFFGCRKQKGDFHCQNEWQDLVDKGYLTLFCAFSQDQEQKIYVQHKIAEQSKLVWTLLHDKNAHFFVAGNAKNMPSSVQDAIVDIAKKEGQLSEEDAKQYVYDLEKCGRYQQETWS